MSDAYRAKIRMYRQGLGDCFLIALPRRGGGDPFFVMVDCGVLQGTTNAAAAMRAVVADIAAATSGKVDLLIATHEHWDHLSGFVQAADELSRIAFGAVWLAWTEDPADPQAQRLRAQRVGAREALRVAESRLRLLGAGDSADEIAGLLDFFGAAGGTTADALDAVRRLAANGPAKTPRYCDPGDAPVQLDGTTARCYVLGPPRDEKLLKRMTLAPSSGDVYAFGAANAAAADGAPFDAMQALPFDVAHELPFFKQHYWGSDVAPSPDAPNWRRIDVPALESSTDLALQLDSATNNTSLVLAIQLGDGDVLLFPADAQAGSWLSWQAVQWTVDGKPVTGRDLLERCVFYKVGHHGSANATLEQHGLELMTKLETAMLSVDEATARRRGWTRMPLPELLTALTAQAGAVIRADKPLPDGSTATASPNGLYYEVTL